MLCPPGKHTVASDFLFTSKLTELCLAYDGHLELRRNIWNIRELIHRTQSMVMQLKEFAKRQGNLNHCERTSSQNPKETVQRFVFF